MNITKTRVTIAFYSTCVLAVACSQSPSKNKTQPLPAAYTLIQIGIMADSLYNQNRYSEAIPFYDSLVKADTTNGQFWYRRAFCYSQVYHSSNNQQAIHGYKKAILLNFRPAVSYFHLATCYLGTDDSTASIYLKESLKIDSTDQDARILLEGAQQRLEMDKRVEK